MSELALLEEQKKRKRKKSGEYCHGRTKEETEVQVILSWEHQRRDRGPENTVTREPDETTFIRVTR